MLSQVVNTTSTHDVEGSDVAAALDSLFEREPGLRNHVLDESGELRPHVSVFVDGLQAGLDTQIANATEIRILHAVSGGARLSVMRAVLARLTAAFAAVQA